MAGGDKEFPTRYSLRSASSITHNNIQPMKRPRLGHLTLWIVSAFFIVVGMSSPLQGDVEEALESPAVEFSSQVMGQISVPQANLGTSLLSRLRSVLGLLVLALVAWILSVDRKNIPWRVVLWGISLQLIFALFILKTSVGEGLFDSLNVIVIGLLGFTVDGARFVFGNLVFDNVPVGSGTAGQGEFTAIPGQVANTGAFFAFNVLPTIIFFSS